MTMCKWITNNYKIILVHLLKKTVFEYSVLTFISKSSKFANEVPNPSVGFVGAGGIAGLGGAGRGGGCFAFFGGKAGDGDSGA